MTAGAEELTMRELTMWFFGMFCGVAMMATINLASAATRPSVKRVPPPLELRYLTLDKTGCYAPVIQYRRTF